MDVKPIKCLKCNMIFGAETPWLHGGAWDGYGYKWEVQLVVSIPQSHSNPDTQTPYEYNALDIKIGDWISGADGISPVKIVEILESPAPTTNSITAIVEDIERFNIMSDPTQGGIGRPTTSGGLVFELDSEGMPLLGSLSPYYIDVTAHTNIMGRFQYRNYLSKFIRVEQENHNLAIGDIIKPDINNVGKFVKVGTEVSLAVGIVSSIDIPREGNFTFKPIGKLITDVTPGLVGNYGDLFYIDPNNPGGVTAMRPTDNIRPLYMRLDTPSKAIMLDAGVEDSVTTKRYDVPSTTNEQINFTLPNEALVVLEMSINGIDTKNFTYNPITHILTFDSEAEGYELETSDSVYFIYRT
jgi:hypothetical protein